MSISVGDIANYLDEQFSSLAASVGQDSDPTTGYLPDITNALRRFGRAESALGSSIEDSDRDAVFVLAEYFALRRFRRLLGDRTNHTMGETSYNFDGQRKTLKELAEEAADACLAYGYNVNGKGWSMGNLNLDWVEPGTAE